MLTYGQTFTPTERPAQWGTADEYQHWGFVILTATHQAREMGGELLPGPPRLVELEPLRGGMRELALSWPVVRVVQW